MKKFFEIEPNRLTLHVTPASRPMRTVLFAIALIAVLCPLFVLIYSLSGYSKLGFGFIISLAIFLLVGFYFLRLALWNTYGKEIISTGHTLEYFADYKWFTGGKKSYVYSVLKFGIEQVGYQEDQEGILVIHADQTVIQCATKIPLSILHELVEKLNHSLATQVSNTLPNE